MRGELMFGALESWMPTENADLRARNKIVEWGVGADGEIAERRYEDRKDGWMDFAAAKEKADADAKSTAEAAKKRAEDAAELRAVLVSLELMILDGGLQVMAH